MRDPNWVAKPDEVRANWSAAGLDPQKLHLHQQAHPPWPEALRDRAFNIGLIDGAFDEASRRADWQAMKSHVTKYVLFHDAKPTHFFPDWGKVFREAAKEWEEVKLPIDSEFGILRNPHESRLPHHRDPRDILVSAHHLSGKFSWPMTFRWVAHWVFPTEPWRRHADTVVRYEDFTIQSPEQLGRLTELFGKEFTARIRIGGPSPTFRAERFGDWKSDFPEGYLGLYERLFSQIKYWEWNDTRRS